MIGKTFYTVRYARPKTLEQTRAMVDTLTKHGAFFDNIVKEAVVTWDSATNEVAFNTAWKLEAPKYLDCVAASVLGTIKEIDNIEVVGVPFEELFYYCDELLSERDVEDGLETLEAMGLVELCGGDWILSTDIAIRDAA